MLPGIVADAGDDEAAAAVAVDFLGREVSAAENGRGTVDGGGEDVLRAIADAGGGVAVVHEAEVRRGLSSDLDILVVRDAAGDLHAADGGVLLAVGDLHGRGDREDVGRGDRRGDGRGLGSFFCAGCSGEGREHQDGAEDRKDLLHVLSLLNRITVI